MDATRGLKSAVQRPKDLSRVRRQAQKLDVFMAERNLMFSWQKLEHRVGSVRRMTLEQGCPTRDPPDRVSRLAATFVNDTQGVPGGICCVSGGRS